MVQVNFCFFNLENGYKPVLGNSHFFGENCGFRFLGQVLRIPPVL
jgi:hypothetical protein